MDIVSYLLELIETRKIVGINALGTLYKKKTPGRYDAETHTFLPPKYEIAFTSDVKEDQELANFISEKRAISIESANFYITEFVESIQAQLADHQQADFSSLGQLKLINDEIVLESPQSISVGFPSYGLPNVSNTQIPSPEPDEQPVYDEIAEVNTIQESNEAEERVDTAQETIEDNKTELPANTILDPIWKPTVINPYEYNDDDDNKKGRTRTFLKVILAILVIAVVISAIVYFLFPNLYYTVKDKLAQPQIESPSSPVVLTDTSSTLKADSLIKQDSLTTQDSIKKTAVITSLAKDSITKAPVSNTIVYEVISSAMKTQKKADEVISNLAKKGIKAKKVEFMPGRRIHISVGTFTAYNEAKKLQDSLKIKLKNPDIYIQIIKPKN